MKNIQDIIVDKKLEFILPRYRLYKNEKIAAKIAVVANLYYLEKFDYYWDYLKNVYDEIDVYIISSNPDLLKEAEKQKSLLNKSNIYFIQKENRGRDISALLVSFGKKIYEYEYICFIHDKRAKSEDLKEDILFWNENLWENMIGYGEHIRNILFLFEQNPNIGLLVPPKPNGKRIHSDFRNTWGSNYNRTVQLAEELGLDCQIDYEISPVALGSVFWCRTKTMHKLFEREWTYEDFMDEPLPDDGTISHAIERIFPFVAQDAGYDTGVVINECYAVQCRHNIIRNKVVLFELLDSLLGVSPNRYLWEYESNMEKACEYFERHENTFIYGAGKIGKQCFKALQLNGKKPTGFIVTKKTLGTEEYLGIPIIGYDEYESKEHDGIIISIADNEEVENVVKILMARNITDYIIY